MFKKPVKNSEFVNNTNDTNTTKSRTATLEAPTRHYTPPREGYIPPRVPVQQRHQHHSTNYNESNNEIPRWTTSDEFNTISETEAEETLKIEEPETSLGESVSFKGELSFERFICIHGNFEGTLISNGKLIVGPKGTVKSDITLNEAIIEGLVEGNVTADRVELRGEAKVRGNIKAKTLSVDEGTVIIGQVNVIPHEDKEEEEKETSS